MLYYYISGFTSTMGMTSSGSFTRDRSRWITFTENEIHIRPYGATKTGIFISCDKF
jgi:hypothetical protein